MACGKLIMNVQLYQPGDLIYQAKANRVDAISSWDAAKQRWLNEAVICKV